MVQRYAVAGRGGDQLLRSGVHVRYVVANPSSYVYFSPERPVPDPHGEFTFAVPAKSCFGKYDRWKYGVNDPPAYLAGASFSDLEQRYLRRDVVYLLGTNDVDPNHPALDKTCSAEDEGPYRFFRGKAFFKYGVAPSGACATQRHAAALVCAGRRARRRQDAEFCVRTRRLVQPGFLSAT